MGLFDRLFNRGKNSNEEIKPYAVGSILAGERQNSLSDRQAQEILGINRDMIKDDHIRHVLMTLAHDWKQDEQGNLIPVGAPDLNMLATDFLMSNLIRTSFIDDSEAKIGQLQAKRFMIRQEMNMNEETYELGGTNLLDALYMIQRTAWSDAKRGRKAKLLKVLAKSFEVNVPSEKQQEKKGGFF